MSKVLSDTAAIAGRYVAETANPDYSCFRPRSEKCYSAPMNPSAGPERVAHAVQVLEAKRPGGLNE